MLVQPSRFHERITAVTADRDDYEFSAVQK
jgi:hypothetical protein